MCIAHKKLIIIIMVVAISVAFSACGTQISEEEIPEYIENKEYGKFVEAYNEFVSGDENKEKQYDQIVSDIIADTVTAWGAEEVDFNSAETYLEALVGIDNSELSDLADEQLAFVRIENNGSTLMLEADKFFNDGEYLKALETLEGIDKSFSAYDSTQEYIDDCVNILVTTISYPESSAQYEEFIELAETYSEKSINPAFDKKRKQLIDEKEAFDASIDYCAAAKGSIEKGDYKSAFEMLDKGLKKLPNNRFIVEATENAKNSYIIVVSSQVSKYVEEKDYKSALTLLDKAKSTYSCDEFDDLVSYVKAERNPLRKIGHTAIDAAKALCSKWKTEKFDVKQAGAGAGAYIIKSGKKLVLGDYTGDEVTLLSFAGEVGASLLGVDALMDARDLSYDIVHWGEDDYFAVKIAVDTVALIPVIGYLKHLDETKDVAKMTGRTADALATGSDAAKRIYNDVNAAKEASENTDAVAKIGIIRIKKRTYRKTINGELINKKHPKTGVKYVGRKLNYSDGRREFGGYPVFDSDMDIQLPEELVKAPFSTQQKYLNKALEKKLKNKRFAKKFSSEEIKTIESGKLPSRLTWHHNEKEGLMQLVDKKAHKLTAHTGGMSLWGIGYN